MNTGTKYNADLNLRDIAKLVRKELKTTFGPAWKFSVRIRRFAGGQSMDVTVTDAPAVLYRLAGADERYPDYPVHSDAGELATKTAQAILDSYNRQDIDSMTDYFNVHFYGSVSIDSDLRDRQIGALRLRRAA